MSPNRLVEFEFDSFLDAAAYLNRPEIAEIMSDIPNHASNSTLLTFILRSDYAKGEEGDWPIIVVSKNNETHFERRARGPRPYEQSYVKGKMSD